MCYPLRKCYDKKFDLERVALTCSQYCTVSLQFFAEKRLHILRNCSNLVAPWPFGVRSTSLQSAWLVQFYLLNWVDG